jgi:hypothetical protein
MYPPIPNGPGRPAPAARPAATQHLPPPARYQIPAGEQAKYANLYSLLTTVELLEEEYANGNVSLDEQRRLLLEYHNQFRAVQRALNLGLEDVKTFANASGLACNYALHALARPVAPDPVPPGPADPPQPSPTRLSQAMKLGSQFVTLSDRCQVGGTGDNFLTLVNEMQQLIQSLGISSYDEVRKYGDSWMSVFQGLKPKENVSPEIIERLKAELAPWEASCRDALWNGKNPGVSK